VNGEEFFISPSLASHLFSLAGLLLLFLGWYLFKAGIYSIGFLSGFTLASLFIFLLNLENVLTELIIALVLGSVMGIIVACALWHIHKYILALVGLLTSLLVNFLFNIPALFEAGTPRVLYLILVTVLLMALFVFAEKHLVIFLTALLGSLLIHRFLLVEWDIARTVMDFWNTHLPEITLSSKFINNILFLLFFLTGIAVQSRFKRRKAPHGPEKKPENT